MANADGGKGTGKGLQTSLGYPMESNMQRSTGRETFAGRLGEGGWNMAMNKFIKNVNKVKM